MTLIPQLDETDCGAACLAMVARHHRSRHSLTSIREIAGTDRQETNLAGFVKAGQALGFSAKPLKGDAEALTPDLEGPFVAVARDEGRQPQGGVARPCPPISHRSCRLWTRTKVASAPRA